MNPFILHTRTMQQNLTILNLKTFLSVTSVVNNGIMENWEKLNIHCIK